MDGSKCSIESSTVTGHMRDIDLLVSGCDKRLKAIPSVLWVMQRPWPVASAVRHFPGEEFEYHVKYPARKVEGSPKHFEQRHHLCPERKLEAVA